MKPMLTLSRRAGIGLLLAGVALTARRALAQQPQPLPPPPPPPPGPPPGERPRHPMLVEADRALRKAREDLVHAEHDFGGHRTKAIQYIDGALYEIRTAVPMR